ncbi:MAG TPA: hypothetical protein VHN36_01765, partial [Ilumatobacteraceae bacterium]|nr:hypothetical protein [Ilumatobacteraceae bacterium]
IDTTAPTAVGFATTNGGGTPRTLEANDNFTLTYSEAVAPTSIIPGWNGVTVQNVVVRADDNAGAGGNDTLTVYDAANAALLPLGTIDLGLSTYVGGDRTFGLPGAAILSTITMSGSSLTIKLGTANLGTTTSTGSANVQWTPATGVTDTALNNTSTAPYSVTHSNGDF